MRRAPALLPLIVAASCAEPAPGQRSATLAGHVAEVAGQPVDARQIVEVARARRVSARQALELIAGEARLAKAADERGLSDRPEVRVARRAALAAALLRSLKRDADATPPTPAELADVRRAHWLELDRPEALSVVHAVALAAPGDPKRPAAQALAERLRVAAAGAVGAEDFKARVDAVKGAVDVTVEPIGPFVRDGRMATPAGGGLDLGFVEGAFALAKPLDVSPPVSSAFGVHVIMLLERLPAITLTDEALAPLATTEVHALRAHHALVELQGRAPVEPEISRNAEELFRLLGSRPAP